MVLNTNMNRHRTRLIAITVVIALSLLLTACIPSIDIFGAGGDKATVTSVEVTATGNAAPTYTAVATGYFPDTCTQMGRTTQKAVRTTIKITIFTQQMSSANCVPESVPFEERVRLDVRGLSAGSYAVDINGATTSFTLTEDH